MSSLKIEVYFNSHATSAFLENRIQIGNLKLLTSVDLDIEKPQDRSLDQVIQDAYAEAGVQRKIALGDVVSVVGKTRSTYAVHPFGYKRINIPESKFTGNKEG